MRKKFLTLCLMLTALSLSLLAQSWTVTGVVMAEGEPDPVIGANVMIKGTTVGTITDIDGQFALEAKKGDVLIFSSMGYLAQEFKVTSDAPIKVTLKADNVMLQEVVAVGYGTMRKSDLTSAITSVSAEDLAKAPVANITQALQGRAAGVTVVNNSGQPGEAATIRIRGIGSAIAGNDPLYVVDGVITNDISFLPSADIASMEILKDASAAAIYGARGANGVIIITTKNGDEGKANVSFDAYWGIQNRWRKLDLMSAEDMVDTKLRVLIMKDGVDAIDNYMDYKRGGLGAYVDNLIGKVYNPDGSVKTCSPYFPYNFDYSKQNTDWQDEVFKRNALIHNYNLRVNGGGKYGHYSFSANYFEQEGTIIGSNYQRLTLRLNTDFNIKKWLVVGEHLSFTNSKSRRAMNNSSSPGASILSAALAMAPWDPTHYPKGSMVLRNGESVDVSGQNAASSNFKNVTNPFSMVSESHPDSRYERWFGDVFIEIKPVEGLTIRPSISIDFRLNRSRTFKDAYEYSSYDKSTLNFLSSSMERYCTLLEEVTATYARKIGKHNFSIMAGQTWSEYNYYSISGSGANIVNPIPTNWYLNKTTENRTESSDGVSRSRRLSAVARLFYSYGDRYMATFNFRADASSVFTKQPWGFFPSASAAWRISEEPFMKDQSDWLDNLKVRLGWGRVGNDANLGSGSFEVTIGSSNSVFYGYPLGYPTQEAAYGAAVLTQANRDGKWETNEQWDAGIDFSFFGGQLNGSIDYFRRNTLDALLYINAPSHVGNKFAVVKNVGNIRNEGFELVLNHEKKIGPVKYNIGGNISYIKNTLTKLNGGNASKSGFTCVDEGLPLNTFWGYQYEGIYQTDEEALAHLTAYTKETIGVHAGDARYRDRNKDGKIDENDKTNIGSPFPKFTYGINLGAEFYGVDIQLFFQGVYGNKIYNALRYRTEGAGDECSLSPSMKNVWVGYSEVLQNALLSRGIFPDELENRKGTIPNPVGSPMNTESSDRYIEDGSYFRLKNLQVGYTFPKKWMEKIHIQRLRLYMTASNVFTITKYTGYDPEIGGGVDYGNYPQSRTFIFGLNVDF